MVLGYKACRAGGGPSFGDNTERYLVSHSMIAIAMGDSEAERAWPVRVKILSHLGIAGSRRIPRLNTTFRRAPRPGSS